MRTTLNPTRAAAELTAVGRDSRTETPLRVDEATYGPAVTPVLDWANRLSDSDIELAVARAASLDLLETARSSTLLRNALAVPWSRRAHACRSRITTIDRYRTNRAPAGTQNVRYDTAGAELFIVLAGAVNAIFVTAQTPPADVEALTRPYVDVVRFVEAARAATCETRTALLAIVADSGHIDPEAVIAAAAAAAGPSTAAA